MQSVMQAHSPSVAALALVEAANERGGRDNITAVVLSVRALTPYEGAAPSTLPSSFAAPEAAEAGSAAKEKKASGWGRRK